MADDNSRSVGVEFLIFVLGAVVLSYIGGAYTAAFETFPYPQLLERPFKALKAQSEKRAIEQGSVVKTGLWHQKRFEKTGLVHRDPGKSYGEYTLYTSGDYAGAYLLDASGEVVHEWSAPFREVWPDARHVDDPVPKSHLYWRRVHLFPDGDIVASYSGEGDTPYGYGMVRVDKDSNVIWRYDGHVHHDFDVREDGSIVALTHRFRDMNAEPIPAAPQFVRTILEDQLVELSPAGEEQGSVSVLDAMVDSRFRVMLESYPSFIDQGLESRWDPLHTNTAELLEADFASHHAFAEPGQVIVSFRNSDTLAIIDMDAERAVWASRGFWRQQHDPDPLPNGRMLVFDNNGYGGPVGASRVVEFDPATNGVYWSYRGSGRQPFWSIGRGSQQVLPNDNVLITESAGGRLFEVTRDGEIVWQFHNPAVRTEGGKDFVAITCSGQRFGADALEFVP